MSNPRGRPRRFILSSERERYYMNHLGERKLAHKLAEELQCSLIYARILLRRLRKDSVLPPKGDKS
jgi:hypothetical protein